MNQQSFIHEESNGIALSSSPSAPKEGELGKTEDTT
jgi:hypothetical protein